MIRDEGVDVEVDDLRVIGQALPSRARFKGMLYGPQVRAFDALLNSPPLQQNQLDDHENRNVPITDFVDMGHPALL
jgi:hypothetical protein